VLQHVTVDARELVDITAGPFLVPVLDHWYITVPLALLVAVGVLSLLGQTIFNDWYNALIKWLKKLLYKEPAAVG